MSTLLWDIFVGSDMISGGEEECGASQCGPLALTIKEEDLL